MSNLQLFSLPTISEVASSLGLPADKFNRQWRAACDVLPCTRNDVDWMVQRHYLKSWPGVVTLIMGMYLRDIAVGMIIYALPPLESNKRYGGNTWELARLWIDDAVPCNAETYLIAQSIHWIRRHRPDVDVLVSYADPSAGHAGTIYKAANWKGDGMSDEGRKTPRVDYVANGKKYSRRAHVPIGANFERVPRVGKYRFVYRLNRAHAAKRLSYSPPVQMDLMAEAAATPSPAHARHPF